MLGSPYRLRDFVHFGQLGLRNRWRQRHWSKHFEAAIRDGSFLVPHAAVVQLIPTEACNLRCAMCNQWGDNGYYKLGIRKVEHMDPDALKELLAGVSPRDSLISVHGGEPFAYKHTNTLLEALIAKQFDVIITTNGTLLDRYLEPLSELRNLAFLLSIDGDEKTHDGIRGKGRFRQAVEAMRELFARRRQRNMPIPVVIMSFTVCEWNTDIIDTAYRVAKEIDALVINYNMRWFLTEEIGLAYERHLREHFGLSSSGAWRGWISEHPDHDYSGAAKTLARLVRWPRIAPPYVVTTPSRLQGGDFDKYFSDYLDVFGNESCFMPFYWARIHANGDLIFCPGHPDIIAGNVFRDGLAAAFNSDTTIAFRKHILDNRFPICNRCCGLYMTQPARPHEQRVRRRLGLGTGVRVHWP